MHHIARPLKINAYVRGPPPPSRGGAKRPNAVRRLFLPRGCAVRPWIKDRGCSAIHAAWSHCRHVYHSWIPSAFKTSKV